jgi:hypothetical protein
VLIQAIKNRYTLSRGDNLQWFLGIEILRNRKEGLIKLSQTLYIDKIAKLAKEGPILATLMRNIELLPYKGQASLTSINYYQRKIRSLLYAAVITRPDIAFATSRLARFNINPSPEHYQEANRALRYLQGTRNLAL